MNKKSLPRTLLLLGLLAFACGTAGAIQYPYAPYNDGKMDPQLTGWPLTPEEMCTTVPPAKSIAPLAPRL